MLITRISNAVIMCTYISYANKYKYYVSMCIYTYMGHCEKKGERGGMFVSGYASGAMQGVCFGHASWMLRNTKGPEAETNGPNKDS